MAPDEHAEHSPFRHLWMLEDDLAFLNHGSFGACPRAVLETQSEWRARMERDPVRFFILELGRHLDDSRAVLAAFLGADPQDLAFVPNATAAANAVLRSLPLSPGDEILVTDHAYNACRNTCDFAAARAGATVVVARVPFPLVSPEHVVDAVLERVGSRTKLAWLDHVTSPTGLVWPIQRLVEALRERGVETMVDGAHAPGMVPVDLTALGAAFYGGNCHKWLCAPKGAGFLHVRRDLQATVRPAVISHGANSPRTDRSRFLLEFDWTGTADPSPYLCVPAALEAMGSLLPGGWTDLMAHNRALALAARDLLCATLRCAAPAPAEMIGALVTLPIPERIHSGVDGGGSVAASASASTGIDPLQRRLLARHRIEVPVFEWPAAPDRFLRISAQIYDAFADFERLAGALREELSVA